MMTYCDKCVHKNVCGNEDVDDPAMNYCKDRMLSCGDCVDRQMLLSYYEYDEQMPSWFIENTPSVQPTYGWINAEDRQPELTSDYLVTVGVNSLRIHMHNEIRTALYNTFLKKWFVHESETSIVGDVIAWMPLPQAYGKDKKE